MNLRYGLYRAKYKYGNKLNLKTPVDVSLELSSKCNMSCSYCYHSEKSKKDLPFTPGFMNTKLAADIIRDAANIGVNSIKFNARGEATLHPDYTTIAVLAKQHAHGMTFIDRIANSNFKIIKKRREEIFLGLSQMTLVKVSFDSFEKEVFDKQRCGGNYDLTLSNIDAFYNSPYRIKSGTRLSIQAVRTKLNKDEDIEAKVRCRWPDAEVSIRDMVEGRIKKDLTTMSLDERDLENRLPCLQAFVRLIIHHDGRVSACCPDYKGEIILGDANATPLKEIFNSPGAISLRKSLKNKSAFKFDPCKNCSSFESYANYSHPWKA